MPSTSRKQHNLMAAVAYNPAVARRKGIPRAIGREFVEADKGRRIGDLVAPKK